MGTTRRLSGIAAAAVAVVGLYGGTAWASAHHQHHGGIRGYTPGVFGTVTAVTVDGASSTCGTAGASGSFTVTAYRSSTVWTVDVTTTSPVTTFVVPGMSGATFANVCVGEDVGALGTVDASTDTVTASTVFVTPTTPPTVPRGVAGTVTAVTVNGASSTCGTSDAAGDFTLTTWRNTSWTVTVSTANPITTFVEPGVSGASFANVCVGSSVGALGSVTGTDALTATKVFIAPPRDSVFGKVAAVTVDGASSTCGTAGASGSFTVTAYRSSTVWTVDVSTTSPATTFVVPGMSGATFANVCVGEDVGALGTVDASTDTVNPTTTVFVAPVASPPITDGVFGTVTAVSVNGASSTCGSADTSGTFTVMAWQHGTPWTVNVSTTAPATTFLEPGVSGASFANVCVGSMVVALGSVDPSTYTVTATKVLVAPTASSSPGRFSWRGAQDNGPGYNRI